MPESNLRTIFTSLLTVMLILGFSAAPVAAINVAVDGDEGVSVNTDEGEISVSEEGASVGDQEADLSDDVDTDPVPTETDGAKDMAASLGGTEVPEYVCTDVGDEVYDGVPWNDLPWINDFPEEAQPPNLPANLVTPRTVAGILVGAAPNQCDVQNPNNPSYDPREDNLDPNADAQTGQDHFEKGAIAIGTYDATLDRSSDGPGSSGLALVLVRTDRGIVDADLTINDGEKDYTINPEIRYWDDGTVDATLGVRIIGKQAAVDMVCDAEGCEGAPV